MPSTLFHVPTREERERMLKNKRAWGLRTSVHLKSDFYDLASFKQGLNSLQPIEQEELGFGACL